MFLKQWNGLDKDGSIRRGNRIKKEKEEKEEEEKEEEEKEEEEVSRVYEHHVETDIDKACVSG